MPIVILRDEHDQRVLPIWVGVFEANAIALQIENVHTPRPMTHDLLRNVIQDLRATVERVVVCDVKDNTFFALIHLDTPSGHVAVDARPSDAIALALRTRAPILVEQHVIDSAKTLDVAHDKVDGERLHQWLESLDPTTSANTRCSTAPRAITHFGALRQRPLGAVSALWRGPSAPDQCRPADISCISHICSTLRAIITETTGRSRAPAA